MLASAVPIITALALVACERKPDAPAVTAPAATSAAGDAYDTSKMDFKPGAAKLSTERHTGSFAAGSALSMDAALKPLVPDPVKEIRLDTTHKIIEIAPGVKFSAWTFGDQVPGPAVRVRVGDRVRFSMTNRSDEPAPGRAGGGTWHAIRYARRVGRPGHLIWPSGEHMAL
jgi:nitrite reductase (NO-forming)